MYINSQLMENFAGSSGNYKWGNRDVEESRARYFNSHILRNKGESFKEYIDRLGYDLKKSDISKYRYMFTFYGEYIAYCSDYTILIIKKTN